MNLLLKLFSFIYLLTLPIGCGSTKPYYPHEELNVTPGKSRIIFTREREFTGSAVKPYLYEFNVVDYNGVIVRDTESIRLDRDRFFWFNPKRLPYISKGPTVWKDDDLPSTKDGFIRGSIVRNCFSYDQSNRYYFQSKINRDFSNTSEITKNLSHEEYVDFFVELFDSIYYRKEQPVISKILVRNVEKDVDCFKIKGGHKLLENVTFDGKKVDCSFCIVGEGASKKNLWNSIDISKEYISPDQLGFNVKVIGKLSIGQTIVWDRDPGPLYLALKFWDGTIVLEDVPILKPDKTYYIHFDNALLSDKNLITIRKIVDSK